ncbi:MAG TPA: glycosyltransferase [Verrucomicrobiae bacterium]|nr:glycosyltransferase [Verrucomicrobiae bacterium]
MKAAVLTYSVSRADGGIYEVTRRTAQSLWDPPRLEVEVLALEDPYTQADLPEWRPLQPRIFRHRGPRACGYAPGLAAALRETNAHVLHIHGIWSYYSWAGHLWARRTRRPYVLTTHGMLSASALNLGRWKKRVTAPLFRNRVLRGAACLQAFTEQEFTHIRAYGLRNPVCIIPNGVDLPSPSSRLNTPLDARVPTGAKVLLFLGRLHPIKGLPNLLRGWANARRRSSGQADSPNRKWVLALGGWDQDGHEAELRKLVETLGLGDSVLFLGPLFGAAKSNAYQAADAFVLPSRSEGLPMAILEAWAHELPVLMTPECNLPEGLERGAALSLGSSEESIAGALEKLFALSPAQRCELGQRGRQLVAAQYSWTKVAAELGHVYQWLVGGGNPPACVRTDW